MSKSLHKFTTQYIDIEDRIQVAGATLEGEILTLWLTHRLLAQLVPTLCHCIERHSSIGQIHADLPASAPRPAHQQQVIQEFEQQIANSSIKPTERVQANPSNPVLLIDEATVELGSTGVNIHLGCTPQNQIVHIAFQPETLRQWMGILFNAYRKSRWTHEIWPNWIKSPATQADLPSGADEQVGQGTNRFH